MAEKTGKKENGIKKVIRRLTQDIWDYKVGLLVAAGYLLLSLLIFGELCPVKIWFHIPCPGCGLTRASLFFFMGQWEMYWYTNPTAVLWIALILYACIRRYVLGKKVKYGLLLLCVVCGITIVWYLCRLMF